MSSSPLKKLNEDLIASTPYENYKKRVGLLNSNSTKLSTQGSKHGSALYNDNLAPNHDRFYGALSNKNTYSPGSAYILRKNKINLRNRMDFLSIIGKTNKVLTLKSSRKRGFYETLNRLILIFCTKKLNQKNKYEEEADSTHI